MSKYKYFPDNAGEMTGFQLQFAFSEIVEEKTKGCKNGSEEFKSIYRDVLKEFGKISEIIIEKETEYFRQGILVN